MIISIIAAMDENNLIGNAGKLPWYLPADLAHFKAITLGKPIVMGRKTYDSIGKPLPERHNIIITRQKDLKIEGVTVVHSLEDAMRAAGEVEELMIIGGANLYKQALPLTNRLYITLVHTKATGDTYFPEWNPDEWEEASREDHKPDDKNKYPYSFITYK